MNANDEGVVVGEEASEEQDKMCDSIKDVS